MYSAAFDFLLLFDQAERRCAPNGQALPVGRQVCRSITINNTIFLKKDFHFFSIFVDMKSGFELSNHLGNVIVTVGDRKLPKDTVGDNNVDHFRADVLSAWDY
jgi:hypothetical protein